ncbi:MAG: aminotransferase class III-fold pyridoxal phosphate-dependent enzyme, partial [Oleiphilus sp.]
CLTKPGQENEAAQFMQAVSSLWESGAGIQWSSMINKVSPPLGFLPPYPFQHKTFLIEPSLTTSNLAGDHNLFIKPLTNDEILQIQQELRLQFLNTTSELALETATTQVNTEAKMTSVQSNQLSQAPKTSLNEDSVTMTSHTVTHLKTLFSETSGIDLQDANPDATFFELGLDSLFLTQLALKLKKSLKSKITFRQLMNDFSSFNKLAAQLQSEGAFGEPSANVQASSQPLSTQIPATINQASMTQVPVSMGQSPLNNLLAQQIQLVNSQIDLLRQLGGTAPVSSQPVQASSKTPSEAATPAITDSAEAKKPFGAGTRINVKRSNELSEEQENNLKNLSERYNQRFKKSKQFAQDNRKQLADPRVVSGFRDKLKEIIYPIVVEKSAGANLWDIDGNCFVDVTCGFGSNFFGNGADFIRSAIAKQLDTGYEIGPQTPFAEKVSKKFCQVTQLERVAFCNTGSEAVLGAIRLARTVTGKDHIVMFENDYHGINDEVIVHRGANGLPLPAAAGVPSEAVANTMILDYGADASLDYIRKHIDDIAAIVIEPVQSRNPELQPKAFIETLRKLCDEHEMALVFDEVITGFRLHPRGAQGYFNIPADIATYGKIIGGGMPIGVIAGKSEYMDALDGGQWQYGDDSSPEVGVTYFAGTFVRHPLAMAAANAVLDKLIAEPSLQEQLGAKTRVMVEQMNQHAESVGAPIKAVHCQSLFRFKIPQDIAYEELIYILLREKGIHIWDARPCFLTTAHTDEDIAKIVDAFKSAVDEMLSMGFFPKESASTTQDVASSGISTKSQPQAYDMSQPPVPGARLGKDAQGKPAWFINDPENPGKFRMIEPN